MNVTIDFNQQEIDRLSEMYQATPAQVSRVIHRTIKKGLVWLKKRVVADVAGGSLLPRAALKNRFFTSARKRQDYVSGALWIGLQDVEAAYAGRLSQQKAGAKAGKHYFEGSFVAKMPSGHRSVYHSTGKKTKTGRTQIAPEYVDVEGADQSSDKHGKDLRDYVMTVLERELNFEVFVKNAR